MLFLQGKWPGCVHHHVSAIPGKRCLMRIHITHFFLLHGTGVLPLVSIVSVLHKIEHAVIFEVLTTKMAGRVAFGEKTKYLFRQREETTMGIAIGGQHFHVSSNRQYSRDGGYQVSRARAHCTVPHVGCGVRQRSE